MIKSLPACFAVKVADSWFWDNAIEIKCDIFCFLFLSFKPEKFYYMTDKYMDLNLVPSNDKRNSHDITSTAVVVACESHFTKRANKTKKNMATIFLILGTPF